MGLERQCVRVIMGQRKSCVKTALDSKCVYNSHLSTPLQSNMPNPHQRAGTAEEDEGERKVREKKRVMRKKGRFWRRLACFHFSRPRAGQDGKAQDEKVEQSEKLLAGSSRCSTDGKSHQRYVNIHRTELCKSKSILMLLL